MAIGWRSCLQEFFKDCSPWRNCKRYFFPKILVNEDISFLCIAFVCDLLLSSRSKRGFKTFPSQLNQSIMDFDPLCLCVGVVQKGTVQIYMKPVTGISTTLMKEVIILHCRVVYQSNVLPGQWA